MASPVACFSLSLFPVVLTSSYNFQKGIYSGLIILAVLFSCLKTLEPCFLAQNGKVHCSFPQ
jgi:hypothetical protein